MQDQHVSEQRQFFEENRKYMNDGSYLWNQPAPITEIDAIYLLILKERFHSGDLSWSERRWMIGIRKWLTETFPKCPICGVYSIGEACGGSRDGPQPYLDFFDMYFNFLHKEE